MSQDKPNMDEVVRQDVIDKAKLLRRLLELYYGTGDRAEKYAYGRIEQEIESGTFDSDSNRLLIEEREGFIWKINAHDKVMDASNEHYREMVKPIRQLWPDQGNPGIGQIVEKFLEMQSKVAEQDKQLKNFKVSWDEQAEEVRSLRAGYTSANSKNNEELYYWEPFAENHLETLTGGVVIRAEWIRQLIQEARTEQDKELQRLQKLENFVQLYKLNGASDIQEWLEEAEIEI